MAGGAAVSTTILSGGVVDAAGTVSGPVVRSSGMLAVYQGGIAFSTVVRGSGQFEVASGGSAAATTVESAGVFTVSGGLATDNVVLSGAVVSITDIVSSGQVVSGLIANAYTSITVDSGGVASGGVIMSGGLVDVVGTDIGTAVEFGGMEYVGGTSIDPIISGLMNGDDPTVSGALITGDGILALGFGGDVIDTTITGSGTLDLYIGAASGPVVFGGNGQLIVDGVTTAAVITGFNSGNTIDLQQLRYTSNWIATVEGQTLVVTEGTITEELQLAGNYNGATFQLAPDAGSDHTAAGGTLITVTNVPCFAAGTLITTDRGPIAVERLSVGDHVLTVEGVAEPILWIGSRAVDCRRHPAPNTIMPVRIRAHALGEGQPRRDLFLSPDHAIFAEGVLIPVKHLLNGSTIMQLTYHVELSRHAVILAEGLPVESYRDTGDRSAFADTHGVTTLHPTFGPDGADTALIAEALGYAPLRVTGPEVERVRNRAQTPAAAAPAPTRRAKG
jgi:autotransporter passenger strand-loop-strand repeat protein